MTKNYGYARLEKPAIGKNGASVPDHHKGVALGYLAASYWKAGCGHEQENMYRRLDALGTRRAKFTRIRVRSL
jgi:hypothetical protein